MQPAVIAYSPFGEALDPSGFASPPFGGFAKIWDFENGIYILLRKNAKANTVTTIFTTKVHAEIELSAPENAQTGAEAQAYSAFSPVNSIIYIWNHNFPCLCRKIVLYFATSKGGVKIVSLPLHIRNIDSVFMIQVLAVRADADALPHL